MTAISTSQLSKQEELELSITVLLCSGKAIIRIVFTSLTFSKNYSRNETFPLWSTKLFLPLLLLLLPQFAFLSFWAFFFLFPSFCPHPPSILSVSLRFPVPSPSSPPPLPLAPLLRWRVLSGENCPQLPPHEDALAQGLPLCAASIGLPLRLLFSDVHIRRCGEARAGLSFGLLLLPLGQPGQRLHPKFPGYACPMPASGKDGAK